MKIGVYSAIDSGPVLDRECHYIAVDRGYTHLKNQGIEPIVLIGDFDSIDQTLNEVTCEILKHPKRKDYTDTELGVMYAIEHGYDEIDIYGVTQKRMDHFLAVLSLLKKYRACTIRLYDDWNCITLLKGGQHRIKKNNYTYLSFFAIEETILSISGCAYNLNDYQLNFNDPLCVSNQIEQEEAVIHNNQDIIMVLSKDNDNT